MVETKASRICNTPQNGYQTLNEIVAPGIPDSYLGGSDSFPAKVLAFMSQKPFLILFVSTANAARSLVAEAIVNARASGLYRARSAGLLPAEEIHAETRSLLQMAGYDTQKLHPKSWQDFHLHGDLVKVDVIVTLSEEAKEALPLEWPGNPVRVHWTLDDPLGAERADVREWKFRKCLSTLEVRINTLLRCRPPASESELLLQFKDIGMVV